MTDAIRLGESVTLYQGDCLEVMRGMEADSVDSIVTDPPYELGFMGKHWDSTGIAYNVDVWTECLRVLKPGGHLLAFGGSRTYHRLACAIEDAGFEIRDQIMWIYGSGFPKSLDVSKAIDKAAGAEREVVGQKDNSFGRQRGGGPGWAEHITGEAIQQHAFNVTAPATPDAAKWQGWGTNLKPSFEPVVWAAKPLRTLADCAIVIQNLQQMEAELCEHIASDAAKSSRLIPPGSSGARGVSAQTLAPTPAEAAPESGMEIGAGGAINSAAAISGSTPEAAHIALNTISLWRRTLEDALSLANKCTTEMASSLTTDLKTWSLSLSQVTPDSIILAASHPNGSSAPVSSAAQYFSVVSAKLSAIQGLIAQGLVSGPSNITPAHEPIVVARKPLIGTVAANVLEYGTGAINIDGCRVETSDCLNGGTFGGIFGNGKPTVDKPIGTGRWPANLIHDGSDEVLALMPQTKTWAARGDARNRGNGDGSMFGLGGVNQRDEDSGSAARFFYCAKASKSDRDEGLEEMPEQACGMMEDDNYPIKTGSGNLRQTTRRNPHPTVKPTDLMRYLVRLVTPPRGTVLDPFMGSGSTGKAAALEGFDFIGIELDADYLEIARRRIEHAQMQPTLEGLR